MSRKSILIFVVLLLLLILGGAGGIWWYLFAPNKIASAELVPSDTVAFIEIPNAAEIVAGYQTSHLKTLIEDPNLKSQIDALLKEIGPKNIELLEAFAPNLSGQSFIAVTHVDFAKPAEMGLIAGLKPKAGLNRFNDFVEKLKATYPEVLKEGKTGTAKVEGIDYQWIQGPGAPDKICVAQVDGWIITSWGEASLKDWIERFQKKSTTPSLAQNPDYRKSLARVGKSMALTYINYHIFLDFLQKTMAMAGPAANPAFGTYLNKKLGGIGGMMLTSSFENGEIADHMSVLIPHQAQVDSGMITTACPFETLKFTGPDTHLYLGTSFDFQQYWKNLQEEAQALNKGNPATAAFDPYAQLEKSVQAMGLDFHRNIIDALGSEFSVQVEWEQDAPYPSAGLFVKLNKPDDFRPTIDAIIKATKEATTAIGVVRELNSNGHTFDSLKFASGSPITPTITRDGPYFGLFLSETQAVRSFQRDDSIGLPHNPDFIRQIGDKYHGASTLLFLDTPYLLDRSYRTAMPYLPIASMFNKDLAALLKGKDLPTDLKWLAPMGPWSALSTPDNDGATGYSISGVGNQGIALLGGVGGIMGYLQTTGMLSNLLNAVSPPPAAPGIGALPVPPPATDPNATNTTNPVAPAPAVDAVPTTNAPPDVTAPTAVPATAPASTAPASAPAAAASAPAPAPSAPSSDTNAPPSTPASGNPQ